MHDPKDVACPYCEGEPRTMEFVTTLSWDMVAQIGATELWRCWVCGGELRLPKRYGEMTDADNEWLRAYYHWIETNRRGYMPVHPDRDREKFDEWVEKRGVNAKKKTRRRRRKAKKPKRKR